eukprot:tig00000144_g9155.t1
MEVAPAAPDPAPAAPARPMNVEAVRAAIARQMDKEIEHKRHELQEVDARIERAERLLGLISNRWLDAEEFRASVIQQLSVPEAQVALVMNSHASSSDSDEEPRGSPRTFRAAGVESPVRMRSTLSPSASRARERGRADAFSPVSSGRAHAEARLPRLVCPVCKRDKFQNILGFVNHCRILHRLVFSSSEEAARTCTVAPGDRRPPVSNVAAARIIRRAPPAMSPRRVPPEPLKRKADEGSGPHPAFAGKRPRTGTLPAPGTIIRAILRRTLVVKNTSHFIPVEARDDPDLSHEWKVSVAMQESDIAVFVKSVRFFLHASFAPNDEVEVTTPPFQVVRRGWGEFPMKVRVTFKNPKQRPVDIEHDLKLDQLYTGKEEFGGQSTMQVEIEQISIVRERLVTRPGYPRPRVEPAQLPEAEKVVYQNAMQFPIIAEDEARRAGVPYACAGSVPVFFSWNIGRRKASEWRRAKLLQRALSSAGKTSMGPGRVAACLRELRLTPYMPPPRDLMRESDDEGEGPNTPRRPPGENRPRLIPKPALFCKYCGSPHRKAGEAFEVLQRSCGVRQRVHGLCSHLAFPAARAQWATPAQSKPATETGALARKLTLTVSDAERASVAAAVAQVAPDATLEEDGEEEGQEPRAHDRACDLLARAGKLFVAELVRAAQRVVEAKKAQERPEEARHKVMVPMHVWLACMQRDRLDFLTNVGLASDPDAL